LALTQSLNYFLLAAVSFILAVPCANASIMISGDVANGSGVLTITNDLSFDISGASTTNFINLVFDEWTTSDGVRSIASPSPDVTLSLNGGSDASAATIGLSDNLAFNSNQITVSDGLLTFLDPTVAGGDTLVIRAGSFALSATAGFNPALNDSTFTGFLFLADSNGLQISNVIPEPTTVSLLALGLLGLASVRRRTATRAR